MTARHDMLKPYNDTQLWHMTARHNTTARHDSQIWHMTVKHDTWQPDMTPDIMHKPTRQDTIQPDMTQANQTWQSAITHSNYRHSNTAKFIIRRNEWKQTTFAWLLAFHNKLHNSTGHVTLRLSHTLHECMFWSLIHVALNKLDMIMDFIVTQLTLQDL